MPKFKNSNAAFWVIFKHCDFEDGAYKLKINLRSMQKEEQTNDLLTRKGRLSMEAANGNSLLKLMQ